MLKLCAAFVLSCLFAAPMSLAEDLNPCPIDSVSKKVRNQTAAWEERLRWTGEVEAVLRKIDSALARNEYEECDLARLKITQLSALGALDDAAQSIPALEKVISISDPSSNPTWQSSLVNLTYEYQRVGDFDNLARLSHEYSERVTGGDRLVLDRSLMVALIGQGRTDEAYANLVAMINNHPESISRSDLSFGFALANRLERADDAFAFQSIADANFGGLWNPAPLPQLEGDALAHLLARETNSNYQMEVTKIPRPNYPSSAARDGIEAQCDVQINIDIEGKPSDVQAMCTHPSFVVQSEKAVRKMRFKPLVIDGTAYEMPDYIYPLDYTLGK